MDNVDNFFNKIFDKVEDAKTKRKLSLLKRRSKLYVKHLKSNPLADSQMIRKSERLLKDTERKIVSRSHKI